MALSLGPTQGTAMDHRELRKTGYVFFEKVGAHLFPTISIQFSMILLQLYMGLSYIALFFTEFFVTSSDPWDVP